MTGHKSLNEIRAELEAALGAGPVEDSEVAESLRRFLAAGTVAGEPPMQATPSSGGERVDAPDDRGAPKATPAD